MISSPIIPPLIEDATVHFANVLDEESDNKQLIIRVPGVFTTNAMDNKYSPLKRIFFKPDYYSDFMDVDTLLCDFDNKLGVHGWEVKKSVSKGTVAFKVPDAIDLNDVKDKRFVIELEPTLYFNPKEKKSGSFYKLISVRN
jgi:hypothetical protein